MRNYCEATNETEHSTLKKPAKPKSDPLCRCKKVTRFGFVSIVFLLAFIFLPAWWFSHFESWTYLDGVYYCFIALSTIGLGDLVAQKEGRPYLCASKFHQAKTSQKQKDLTF